MIFTTTTTMSVQALKQRQEELRRQQEELDRVIAEKERAELVMAGELQAEELRHQTAMYAIRAHFGSFIGIPNPNPNPNIASDFSLSLGADEEFGEEIGDEESNEESSEEISDEESNEESSEEISDEGSNEESSDETDHTHPSVDWLFSATSGAPQKPMPMGARSIQQVEACEQSIKTEPNDPWIQERGDVVMAGLFLEFEDFMISEAYDPSPLLEIITHKRYYDVSIEDLKTLCRVALVQQFPQQPRVPQVEIEKTYCQHQTNWEYYCSEQIPHGEKFCGYHSVEVWEAYQRKKERPDDFECDWSPYREPMWITCPCGANMCVTGEQVEYYQKRGYELPKRCSTCKEQYPTLAACKAAMDTKRNNERMQAETAKIKDRSGSRNSAPIQNGLCNGQKAWFCDALLEAGEA